VRIIGARINANNTVRTTEQLLAQKKEMHLSAFRFGLDELAMVLASKKDAFDQKSEKDKSKAFFDLLPFESFTSAILAEARTFLERHEQVDAKDYLEEETYRSLVVEMLAAKRMAESKMELYLADESLVPTIVGQMKLRVAHRYLMAFLRKQVCDESIDAKTRTGLALSLCKAEGLIRASVDEQNELGEQVILQGSADGWDYDKLWLLVRAGADVNGSEGAGVPLSKSAVSGRTRTVKALAELKANVNNVEADGSTALFGAAVGGHTETVKLLVDLKIDINHESENNGLTALILGVLTGQTETVKVLVELKADVNHVPKIGGHGPALFTAIGAEKKETVKLLAELKADVNHATENGTTALMVAVLGCKFTCNSDFVKLILQLKGDVSATNSKGKTASIIAAEAGLTDIVPLLQGSGAGLAVACDDGAAR
jgi:uncharacterized protein